MDVIFLDIDGVLNSNEHFVEIHTDEKIFYKAYPNYEYRKSLENIIKPNLFDINFEKLQLLKKIVRETDCKIVVSSAWRLMTKWPLIEEYLISKGLPIIGTTPYIDGNRGEEIRSYLKGHKEIENFIILDEEKFISVVLKGYCIGENNEKYTMTGPVPEAISYNNNDTKFYLVNTINNENGDVIYTNGTTKYSSEINWNNVRIKSCKIEKMIAHTKESNGETLIEKELNFKKEFK